MLNERIGGHPDSKSKLLSLQLRDSVGFTPNFPRYLWRLTPTRTDGVHHIALYELTQPDINKI
jgi:hypothetical protein